MQGIRVEKLEVRLGLRCRQGKLTGATGWLSAAIGALCMLALSGCSTSSPPQLSTADAVPQTQSLEAAPAKKAPVKVALLVPLSGAGAGGIIGKSLKQAAELAIFERDNPAVQLVVKDDKGTPEGARAAADEALKDGAGLILGPLFAKSVSAVAPVARAQKVPVVAFSNDRQVAGNGVYLLGFQPAPEVNRIVSYASERGKKRFVALVPDDPFGRLAGAAFKDAVARAGGDIVASETYPMSANAVLEPLRKIATVIEAAAEGQAPIDAFFLPGGQEHLELVGRLLPQANIDTTKVKIIGTGGMDYPNVGRDQRLVGAWFPGPDPSGWNDFSQKYAKSYGQAPPRIAALAFDGISLAIALSGDAGPNYFTPSALTRANGFSGVDGTFRLTPEGSTERGLAILEVQKFGGSVIEPPAAGTSQPPQSGLPRSTTFN